MANEVGNKVADMVMDMEDKPGQTRADRDKPGMITQKCVEMGQIHNFCNVFAFLLVMGWFSKFGLPSGCGVDCYRNPIIGEYQIEIRQSGMRAYPTTVRDYPQDKEAIETRYITKTRK